MVTMGDIRMYGYPATVCKLEYDIATIECSRDNSNFLDDKQVVIIQIEEPKVHQLTER